MQATPVRIQSTGMVTNDTDCSLLGELKGAMLYTQSLGIYSSSRGKIAVYMHYTSCFLFVERKQ